VKNLAYINWGSYIGSTNVVLSLLLHNKENLWSSCFKGLDGSDRGVLRSPLKRSHELFIFGLNFLGRRKKTIQLQFIYSKMKSLLDKMAAARKKNEDGNLLWLSKITVNLSFG